jgi:pyruvate/2-oxoglutarate dehydrogenase complex dihydrolipoamide acyltransferase (E2) component
MSIDVVMPKLGAEMQSARITSWNKAEGTAVQQNDILVTIETDKVAYDVEAPAGGILHIVAKVGQELPTGAVMGQLADTPEEYQRLFARSTATVS